MRSRLAAATAAGTPLVSSWRHRAASSRHVDRLAWSRTVMDTMSYLVNLSLQAGDPPKLIG